MQYNSKIKSHRPKGSMCASCKHRLENCSKLPFKKMQAIGKDNDGVVVIKCSEFNKEKIGEFDDIS